MMNDEYTMNMAEKANSHKNCTQCPLYDMGGCSGDIDSCDIGFKNGFLNGFRAGWYGHKNISENEENRNKEDGI